jgi:hypothetical protein
MSAFAVTLLALRFIAESVSIEAGADGFVVDGTYVFERDGAGEQTVVLTYPFLGGGVDPASVQASGARLLEADAEQASLGLRFGDGQTRATMRVRYRQRLGPRRAGYLVTSAQSWGEPIGDARFSLKAPRDWGEPQSSWPLPEASCDARACVWAWAHRPFAPKTNLDVQWQPQGAR